MKEALLLTKVFFNSSIDFSRKKKKHNSSILFICLIGLLFAILLGTLSYLLFRGTLPLDIPKHSIIIMCLTIVSFLGLIVNFFSMYSVLFKAKDFDFLVSSPLKKSSIIAAKLMSMFLFTFIIDGIGMIPVIIIYMIKGGTAIGFICAIVGTIFAGVIPLLFSTLIGALVGILTVKLKNGDNITVIVYILLFIGLTVAMTLTTSSSNFILNADKILPYYRFLSNSFVNNNGLGLLYFILINIGATIVVVIFTSLIYFPINKAKMNHGDGTYKSGKEKTTMTTTRFLFRKEIRMIVKNPLFLLSTYAMTIIIFAIGIILVGFLGKGFISRDAQTLQQIIGRLKYFQTGFGVLVGSLCISTYASFSMEGRDNFEQLFVYPLDKKEVIKAKIKASIIPQAILLAVTNALLVLIFAAVQGFSKIPVWIWLSIIILPVLSCFSATYIGTLCGLKWIKLDFVDANDVLKKSKALGMTAAFSFLLNLGLFGVHVALCITVPKIPYLGLLVASTAEIISIIILKILVNKKSLKLLEEALIK